MHRVLLEKTQHEGEQHSESLKRVRCVNCQTVFCRANDAFTVDGNITHVFTNPHGYTFKLATFRNVENVKLIGSSSTDWTWFPPYAWTLVHCSGCNECLGWSFSEPAQSIIESVAQSFGFSKNPALFTALIVQRIEIH